VYFRAVSLFYTVLIDYIRFNDHSFNRYVSHSVFTEGSEEHRQQSMGAPSETFMSNLGEATPRVKSLALMVEQHIICAS
jgi:hypothetical protein